MCTASGHTARSWSRSSNPGTRVSYYCDHPPMRIGTWNLAGRWRPPLHEDLLLRMDCDVLVLTEVRAHTDLPGYDRHLSVQEMAKGRRWAGVFSRIGLTPLPDPHPASAMAVVGDLSFCSSILPWRSCGDRDPWGLGNHAAKTQHVVDSLLVSLPRTGLVWGGDWNHALEGREYAGSIGGRESVLAALDQLELQVPTAKLRHQSEELLSIDHIAVPRAARVLSAEQLTAERDDGRLSDHDAYVIEVMIG